MTTPKQSVEIRYVLHCERCGSLSMFGRGYGTEKEAAKASLAHALRHEDQPYCICDTIPAFSFSYDDEGDMTSQQEDEGHSHCRCAGGCCECGCLSRERRPE